MTCDQFQDIVHGEVRVFPIQMRIHLLNETEICFGIDGPMVFMVIEVPDAPLLVEFETLRMLASLERHMLTLRR